MAKPAPTWKPHEAEGKLDTQERNDLPDSVYAFPKQRERTPDQRRSRPQRRQRV